MIGRRWQPQFPKQAGSVLSNPFVTLLSQLQQQTNKQTNIMNCNCKIINNICCVRRRRRDLVFPEVIIIEVRMGLLLQRKPPPQLTW